MEIEILYEDDYLCVINKPSGLASQDSNQKDILHYFPDHFIIHRLDQRVSGVLILAKTTDAAAKLSEAFKNNTIKKEYLAVTKSKPNNSKGSLHHWHIHDLKSKKAKVFDKEIKDSKPVSLDYELLKQSDRYFLFKIQLNTGRFHQIRAQFSAISCPIVGDLKYGFDRSTKDGSIFLHSHVLEFQHPINKQIVRVVCSSPEYWKKFGL